MVDELADGVILGQPGAFELEVVIGEEVELALGFDEGAEFAEGLVGAVGDGAVSEAGVREGEGAGLGVGFGLLVIIHELELSLIS